MDFALTETQHLLQDTANRLVRERYGFEERKKILASPAGSSPELWASFAELGLLGIEIAERFGGSEGGFHDLAVVLDAFGRGLVAEPFVPTVVMGAGLISRAGSEAQKAAILPGVAAGTLKLALAYGERRSRYSLNHVETTAKADGDFYVIDGQKSVVLGGDAADQLIVSARTAGKATDPDGISLFLVERGAAGVAIRGYPTVDGTRAAEVTLTGVRVAKTALLGSEDQGLGLVDYAVDRGIAAMCNEALGVMAALNELTLEYLKTRVQFGRPIGKFQVLQHRMVDMEMALEQAKSMAILAAAHVKDGDPRSRAKAISAAKVQIGKSGQVVGRGAIQLHGGIGMTEEYIAAHFFKRLTAIEICFGDIDHHLARFARS
ncbi:MAG: Acyl-CoA dehydrogenase family protein [Rhodospirillales bacterium]|nr:Acyl-CoA dehydrogenase family protein [Rhodospirillales bacterium]